MYRNPFTAKNVKKAYAPNLRILVWYPSTLSLIRPSNFTGSTAPFNSNMVIIRIYTALHLICIFLCKKIIRYFKDNSK